MINKIGIQNFRVFKEHAEFNLAPITILTGTNNSGKSSLLKLLALLQKNFSENNNISYLSFDGGDHNLGTFENVCNWNTNSKSIKLLFDFPLDYFNEDFQLELTYHLDNEDGKLESFKIFNENRVLLHINNIKNHSYILNFDIEYLKNTVNREFECYNLDNYPSTLKDEVNTKGNIHLVDNKWFKRIYDETTPREWFKKRALDNYKEEYNNALNRKRTFFDYEENYLIDNSIENIDIIIELEKENTVDLKLFNEFDKETDFIEDLFSSGFGAQIGWSFLDNLNDDFGEDIYANFDVNDYKEIQEILFKNIHKSIKELKFSFSNFSFMSASRGNKKRILENKSINDIDEIVKEFNQINLYSNDIEFLNKSMSLLNINGEISIKRIEGVASIVYLKEKEKLIPLTDLGYGYSQVIPILLKILMINKNTNRRADLFFMDGAHRNMLVSSYREKHLFYPALIIEEPEANLHPNLQSRLADVIILANKTFGIHFILETHSEYLIRKLQYLTAKKDIEPKDVIIYYYNDDRYDSEKDSKIKHIQIDEFGGLSDTFGTGFFDEAIQLQFELLKLNQSQSN